MARLSIIALEIENHHPNLLRFSLHRGRTAAKHVLVQYYEKPTRVGGDSFNMS